MVRFDYQYFGGKLIKNATGYVGQDRLGSIGKYFPYGQERPSATTNGKEKFTGYIRDAETGLDYAQHRYHSAGDGRFLTPDPYAGSAISGDPGSWNRYAYVGGDPANLTDPNGAQANNCPEKGDCYCVGGGDPKACDPLFCLTYPWVCVGGVGLPPIEIIDPPGGGGNPNVNGQVTSAAPTAQQRFDALSTECQAGLKSAMPNGGKGSGSGAADRMAAYDRVLANKGLLQTAAGANGIEWEILAAIAVQESGFKNIRQIGGGQGVGVFQIDLGQNPSVTAAQASDVAWAANFAARFLASNMGALSAYGLTGSELLNATFNSYNAGVGSANGGRNQQGTGVIGALAHGRTADSASYNKHYGSTALDLMKCF